MAQLCQNEVGGMRAAGPINTGRQVVKDQHQVINPRCRNAEKSNVAPLSGRALLMHVAPICFHA